MFSRDCWGSAAYSPIVQLKEKDRERGRKSIRNEQYQLLNQDKECMCVLSNISGMFL